MTDTAAFPLSIKALSPSGEIEGLAAVFGNVDHGGDRIMPGAFAKTISGRGQPLPMLLHHKLDRPIGRWDTLAETPEGLLAKGRITLDATDGREAHALARDGALGGLSIGYRATKTVPTKSARELHEIALFEVSLVSIPMNPLARVTRLKSIGAAGDLAELLREAGFSGRKAKEAAGAAWRILQEDPDPTETKLAEILAASSASLARYHSKG